MLSGLHAIIYAEDAEKARAFFRDALGRACVDAGGGWLIFAMPPAELAFHPAESDADEGEEDEGAGSGAPPHHQLFLMCDDVAKTVAELKTKGVEFTSPVMDRGWGLMTMMRVPGAGEMGLYQPKHPTALGLK